MGRDGIPFKEEDLIASAVEALKVRGDARSIAVLVTGKCTMQLWDSDYGIDSWRLFISLPVHLFYAMSEDERKVTECSIEAVIHPFFSSTPGYSLESVVLSPLVVEAQEGWREEALRFVKGEGVTNQGRVRSDNIASKQHQGLLFRSKAEITLFSALTRAKLAAPAGSWAALAHPLRCGHRVVGWGRKTQVDPSVAAPVWRGFGGGGLSSWWLLRTKKSPLVAGLSVFSDEDN